VTSSAIAIVIATASLILVMFTWRRGKPRRVRNKGYTLPTKRPDRIVPWYPQVVPPDATHMTYILVGEGPNGRTFALRNQTIAEAIQEAALETCLVTPVIRQMCALEDDLYQRGCQPVTEVRFVLTQHQDGGERWWSGRKWLPRWHRDAAVYDIWGTKF
jgi:hypothetical protein